MMDAELLRQRLEQFVPEPLIELKCPIPEIVEIPMVKEDANTIDLAKANYLNMLNIPEMKTCAEKVIREYGVGTCGPRAFYGTTDVHLTLEEKLASFLHLQESIVYSFGFVAISSSIAAYCKRSDVVFVDEFANFPIHQGLIAAKCKVVKFAHNNPDSLRMAVTQVDPAKRKFLIIEGINWETGQLCDLPKFLDVAETFKMRVFLEESYTIGVFGATGRGLTEHYNVDPTRVDMIFGTLEGAIGSIGGFCAGSELTIEHQRLSGSGYIFSASLPTYLVQMVIKSLEIMGDKPRVLSKFAKKFHCFLQDLGWDVRSHPNAPFKLVIRESPEDASKIWKYCRERGLHFIHKENKLIFNLNINLIDDNNKLSKTKEILRDSAKLIK